MKTLTIKHDIINASGEIRFHTSQKVIIREIERQEGYYGKSSGKYYPEKIIGIKLVGEYGIWFPTCFKENMI